MHPLRREPGLPVEHERSFADVESLKWRSMLVLEQSPP